MIAGILLAAGESRRMGFPKPLLPYRGTTFLEHLLTVLQGRVNPLVLVLGAHADRIRAAVRIPDSVIVAINENYAAGQLSSLQIGIRALPADAEAAMVALVDHPCIDRALVERLISEWRENHPPVLIPTYNERRGHPMIFHRDLFAELLEAPLDQGARAVVRRHTVHHVPVKNEGILHDLDDPQAYRTVTGLEVPQQEQPPMNADERR
jgi:molybdenum cofactor cytidylyltransferase